MPTERTEPPPDRSRLLLEINNAIVSQLDLRELLKAISLSLRQALPHDGALLTLHEADSARLRLHALDLQMPDQSPFAEGVLVSLDDTPEGRAITSRRPVLVCPTVDLKRYSSPWVRRAVEHGVRSGCAVPLIAHERTLGALSVVSTRENAFNEADAELLNQCASQIAIAVENALNFQRAKQERDRFEMTLAISNAVSASFKLRELLQATSTILRRHIHHDFSGLALYEEDSQQFRFLALDDPPEFLEEGSLIPLEGTPEGLAFKTRQAVWRERVDLAEFPAPSMQQAWQAGMRSGCAVPLISRDRVIGVLGVGSNREASITQTDAETLQLITNQIASAVENALNFERARQAEQESRRQYERERLMLEINNAVVSQLDLRELVRVISTSLREVLHPDVTGISLYDPETNMFRAYRFDMPESFPPIPDGTPMPLEGTVGGLAFESGQPIFMGRYDPAMPLAEFDRALLEAGIQSGGVVPLIAHDKKLGFLGVGSFREDAFPPADQELLCHIANQIAIAVENSLNFERALQAEQAMKRQLERERLMLEINNAVVSELSLRELFRVISAKTREVLGNDTTSMAIYDAETNQLRAYVFDHPDSKLPVVDEGTPIPLQGSLGGTAFTTGQPVFVQRGARERTYTEFDMRLVEAGIKSGGCVPLIAQDRKLGVMGVGSFREDAFSEADQELLGHIANQIALAVENALNFERAVKAEQDVQRQFERLQLMLEVNNATVTQLDLLELVRVISDCLREALQLAIAGVSLYDAEANCLRAYYYDLPNTMTPIPAGTLLPLEGSIAGRTYTTGQPVLLNRPEEAAAFPVSQKLFFQTGIQSGGCVPLIVQGRKLGVLGVDSYEPDAFPPERQQLLCQIADQLALAVDNALNYERARKAEQAVQRKLEREQLMLKITNAVVAHLDLQELLRVISSSICEALDNDSVGVGLFDQASGQLRVFASDYPPGHPLSEQGISLPLEGTPSGLAFTSGQPVFLDQPDFECFPAALVRQVYEMGYRSGVSIPLIAQGRRLGVLGISSKRENAFSDEDKELICQVANQVAIAVDNALNFERAVKAEQQVQRKLEREQLMLRINNALVTQLDLRELVRVVSSCLRESLYLDVVGLSLYYPETNELRAYAYDLPNQQFAIPQGTPIPLGESLGGRVFTSGQSLFFNRPDPTRSISSFNQRFVDAGVKSGGCVPLVAYGRKLGVLGVASFREDAFPPADQELLSQVANQIALAVKNALDYQEIESLKNKLTEEKLYLEEEINTAYNFEEIIGSSGALRRILKQVETVAPTDSTVLIVGETGTGKELIARAIHNLSTRRERTLVKLNCAAIPTGLLESELFGHEKGAFTGAIAQRVGRFELAHKGSMFLDEIGEIPLELQPKLLRVLQEQEFERLGNPRTQRVDVRLIAATNRDLAAMSTENRFRSDLYYRLNVFPITIPPLRERTEDIPLLARFFANKFAARMKKQIKTIPADAVAVLQRYHWPGNIRELENMIERAVILTQGAELNIPLPEMQAPLKATASVARAAPAFAEAPAALSSGDAASLEAVEREHILRILREVNWVVGGPTGAAARLGMKRTTLQNRMAKLGIARPG